MSRPEETCADNIGVYWLFVNEFAVLSFENTTESNGITSIKSMASCEPGSEVSAVGSPYPPAGKNWQTGPGQRHQLVRYPWQVNSESGLHHHQY